MPDSRQALHEEHEPEAISRRLAAPVSHSYLADAVLGAIDGCVTTLAVVAGAVGAKFPPTVAIVLGLANLLADGFSMAVSNYQSGRTREDQLQKTRREEYDHIARFPEGEVEEIRQIFVAKGFSGATLDDIVATITSDVESWVDTMLVEEHGLALEVPHPWLSALATFFAFIAVGLIPLLPFMITSLTPAQVFPASVVMSLAAFFAVGVLKGHVLNDRRLRFGLETMMAGSMAGLLAYAAGSVLRDFFGITEAG
ncbi:MAG: VIT1/CCC1 transporter family protein [Woeseiaceae bacterium]|nr:VIT1/CCC1 transporter family protein [Woeseiaceae bacterium]